MYSTEYIEACINAVKDLMPDTAVAANAELVKIKAALPQAGTTKPLTYDQEAKQASKDDFIKGGKKKWRN
jgi:hypothetical protein